MKSKTLIILGIVIGLVGVLAFTILYPRLRPFNGMVIQSQELAHDFSLTSANATEVSLSDFRGKVVVLYFGYTFCPDVCPATLSSLSKAMDILGKKAEDVQFIMISVDPDRDTPDRLAEYVAYFNPTFIGVTGDVPQLEDIAALYGIFFNKHEGTAATGYLVDHTATLMVIDRDGYLKLVMPFGATPEEIASDLRKLLQ